MAAAAKAPGLSAWAAVGVTVAHLKAGVEETQPTVEMAVRMISAIVHRPLTPPRPLRQCQSAWMAPVVGQPASSV